MAPRGPVSPGHRTPPQAPSWDEYKAHGEAGLTPRGCDVTSQSTRRQGHDSRHKTGPELLSRLCQGPPMVPSPLSLLTEYARIEKGSKNSTAASVHCSQQAATRDPVPQCRPLDTGLLQQHTGLQGTKASHRADHRVSPTLTQTGERGEYRES